VRHRRRVIPLLLAAAASLAVALPIVGGAVPSGAVLPDLVADPPAFPAIEQHTFPDATQSLLLRFDGYVHNIGPGPLEVRGANRVGAEFQTTRQYVQTPTGMQATDPPTAGKYPRILYETEDGHNHFHLQKIARYSLWNQARTAEVAPGQKVGFCLEDTQRRETTGPANPVYENLNFCNQGNPSATSLTTGISAGWRDRYGASLALQWVDISDVQPGVYRLGAEIDTDNVIVEASEANNTVAFAAADTTVPGYRAQAVNAGTLPAAQASTITLRSQTFGSPGARRFRIASLPAAGVLRSGSTVLAVGSTITGDTVTYTPNSGASGPDTFTYTALDSTSQFPRTPAAASVTLTVGTAPVETTVAISGAPATLNEGTSAQLSATVANGPAGVTWAVNGVTGGNATVGTITTTGLYVAPANVPSGGAVTIRATSTAVPTAFDEVTIQIVDPGPVDPAPDPGTNFVANGSFETNLANWTTWQASLSRVQLADAPLGVTVARVARTAGTSFTLDDTPDSVTNATAGTTYTGAAYVKSAAAASLGKTVRVHLRERSASGAVLRTISGPTVTLTDSFQRVSAEVSPQAAGNRIEIYLAHLGAVAGSAFYVDAISLTNGQGGNQPPTASFGATTLNPTVGQQVTFSDNSTDEDGTITARAWDLDGDGAFDDGTGTTATWTYTSPGTVTARIRVTDDDGASSIGTRTVTVTSSAPANTPPAASFIASTLTPQTGATVTFTDTSTDSDGTIVARAWDLDGDGFDDGTGATASRVYTTAGEVTVRIRVTDDDAAETIASRTLTVSAAPPSNTPPVAAFDASTLTPQVGATVTFTDTSTDPDGTIVARAWDLDGDGFDDGTGATASRAYTAAGPVTVRLRVTDDDSAETIASRTITVESTTPPGGANLIANGSFETNLTGWTTWQASLAREQVAGTPAGSWAVKVTRTAGTAFTLDDSPTTVTSAAATTYRARVAVRAATTSAVGKPFEVFFRERSPSGTVLRNFAGPTVVLTNTFQVATADLAPLAAGNQLEVYFSTKQAVSGMAVYIDDAQLRTD